jgi:hypothetical protein
MHLIKHRIRGSMLAVAALDATTTISRANTLPCANYSGSLILDGTGYACSSGACTQFNPSVNQPVTAPGTISNSVSVPLISDGSYGTLPAENYPAGATASGTIAFSQTPSPSMSIS